VKRVPYERALKGARRFHKHDLHRRLTSATLVNVITWTADFGAAGVQIGIAFRSAVGGGHYWPKDESEKYASMRAVVSDIVDSRTFRSWARDWDGKSGWTARSHKPVWLRLLAIVDRLDARSPNDTDRRTVME